VQFLCRNACKRYSSVISRVFRNFQVCLISCSGNKNIVKSTKGPSWKFTREAQRTVKTCQKFTWLLCPEDFPRETLTSRLTRKRECRPSVIFSMHDNGKVCARQKRLKRYLLRNIKCTTAHCICHRQFFSFCKI